MPIMQATETGATVFAAVESCGFLATRQQWADSLEADDVRYLRRVLYADGLVSREEAAILLDLKTSLGPGVQREWQRLHTEASTDHLVNQVSPAGYIGQEDGAWLLGRLDDDAPTPGPSALAELLVVMERARSVPDPLSALGLRVVDKVVLTGQGGNSRRPWPRGASGNSSARTRARQTPCSSGRRKRAWHGTSSRH